VLVEDKAVSRRHAELIWDEAAKAYALQHVSTTNLTWLNDQALEMGQPVASGDRIKLGTTVLLVEPEVVSDERAQEPVPQTLRSGALAPTPAPRPVALRQEAAWRLKIVAGPEQGRSWDLTGLYLTVGCANRTHKEIAGKDDGLEFDISIELAESQCLPNHLVLRWNELETAYTTWKNPAAAPVMVRRTFDGMPWVGQILGEAGLLRAGDVIELGAVVLALQKPTA
jgi:hypothetical protein